MRWELRQGDALRLLSEMPAGSVDACITDPPYSSGGFTRGDRAMRTGEKYQHTSSLIRHAEFTGDNRDQRSWITWSAIWMQEALRVVKPSGYLLTFSDWRQLPACSDAIQAGGWVWRGVIVWNKTEAARAPHTGYFRHQCEYVLWGTGGVSLPAEHSRPMAGLIEVPAPRGEDRLHMTEKPVALMRQLVQIVPPDGVVLDPFCGSGSTGVAALGIGRRFIGFELQPSHFATAKQRLEDTEAHGLELPVDMPQLFPVEAVP